MAGEASEVFEKQARAQLKDELMSAYGPDCTQEQVLEAIDRAWRRFDQVPVREFVPLLAAKIAREELRVRRPGAGPHVPWPLRAGGGLSRHVRARRRRPHRAG